MRGLSKLADADGMLREMEREDIPLSRLLVLALVRGAVLTLDCLFFMALAVAAGVAVVAVVVTAAQILGLWLLALWVFVIVSLLVGLFFPPPRGHE